MSDRRQARKAISVVASVLLALVAVGAAILLATGQTSGEHLETGKKAFGEFYFHEAKVAFAAALAEDPDDSEAAYAYARTVMVLNEYEEAIPSFERALVLDPDDPRSHEGYLNSLVWGGVLRGRRAWLEQAIESGGDAVRRFPNLAGAYDLIEKAAGDLNEPDLWLQILASLEPHVGDSPVFRVHRAGAKLARARSTGDADAVAVLEQQLRAQLEEAVALESAGDEEAGTASESETAARRYQLAYGYKLLDDTDQQREWLARLEETGPGQHLAAQQSHFDVHYRGYIAAREEPVDARLELLDRWQRRFPARWDNEDFTIRRVPMDMRLDELRREAGRREAAEPSSPEEVAPGDLAAVPDDVLVDQIVALTEQLGRFNTWGGATPYVLTARELLAIDRRPEEALRLADIAAARLEQGLSGMIYPGTAPELIESETANTVAALEHVRGQALQRLGRTNEAETALRAAVELSPRSDRVATLGEFLVAEDRAAEGYEVLVEALAWNAEEARIKDESSLREATIEARIRVGRSESAFDRDLAAASERVAVERRARIVGHRLDLPAPDFVLTDTHGGEWRLSQLAGKVVVLNYWATWCGPCRAEFPHYAKLVDEYAEADDVVFLAITTDTDHSVARDFLEENSYGFTVLFDEGSATDFHVTGIPSHFIVGRGGRIQYRASGFPGEAQYAREMRWRIEELR